MRRLRRRRRSSICSTSLSVASVKRASRRSVTVAAAQEPKPRTARAPTREQRPRALHAEPPRAEAFF
eukprot:1323273-Pleurochrysis_carterae.AAC.1